MSKHKNKHQDHVEEDREKTHILQKTDRKELDFKALVAFAIFAYVVGFITGCVT